MNDNDSLSSNGSQGGDQESFQSAGNQPPVDAPLMGKVLTIAGKQMILMGGKPKADWSGLDQPSKNHPNQYRSLDPCKSYKVPLGLKPLDPVWSKTDRLSTLQNHVLQTLTNNGMEQHAWLPHPHKPTEMVNAVLNPFLFGRNLG